MRGVVCLNLFPLERLHELIFVLKRNNLSPSEEDLPQGSKLRKLHDLVWTGEVHTDEEAIRLLYDVPHEEKRYRMLKRCLTRVLSQLVLGTSVTDPDYTDHQNVLFKKKKELMIAENLLNQNVYHNAEVIILKVKAYAERFHMLELQVDCVKHLRTVYTLKGYPKEVELYSTLMKRLNKLLQHEHEAVGFIDLLESRIKYSIGKYREIAVEARQFSMQIREWQKESASPTLKLYQYKIDLIRCYHTNDTREWQVILNRLTELTRQHAFLKTESLMFYLNMEWGRYLRCKANIIEAGQYVEKALRMSDYAAFNKFEAQALHFDLKMKERNYDTAGKILEEVRQCLQFYLLDVADRAAWLLREAYLYFAFVSLNDKSNIEAYTTSFTEGFSVSELVQQCKAISRDKKGYNFMLVVLREVLQKYRHPGETENGANNLVMYYQRYMKDGCEERSKTFMKKITRLNRFNFSDETAGKEAMAGKAGDLPENFDAAELISYDAFVELFLCKMEKKTV